MEIFPSIAIFKITTWKILRVHGFYCVNRKGNIYQYQSHHSLRQPIELAMGLGVSLLETLWWFNTLIIF